LSNDGLGAVLVVALWAVDFVTFAACPETEATARSVAKSVLMIVFI